MINGCSSVAAGTVVFLCFPAGPVVTHTSQSERAILPQNRPFGLIKVMFQAATWPVPSRTHTLQPPIQDITHTHTHTHCMQLHRLSRAFCTLQTLKRTGHMAQFTQTRNTSDAHAPLHICT